jgi:hypothetical protein
MLDREALPASTCSRCGQLGRWRCRDCMFPTLQCRTCMRNLHQHEPLHRIECWTGKYFRAAAMWEVGVYMLIRHCGDSGLCDTLKFQKDVVDGIQRRQDIKDQDTCRAVAAATAAVFEPDIPVNDNEPVASNIHDNDQFLNDKNKDDLIFAQMDRLHARQQKDKIDIDIEDILLEDEDNEGEKDCVDESFAGFNSYLNSDANGTATATANTMPTATDTGFEPAKDAFNNHYLRIVHVNGIHHLAVISCTCRGVNNLPIDLMYSRLVPTSFIKIRTLFTTMVLDTFRLANLEMKASAYQYFQLIHRLTSKTTSNVPNLYHDLRKLSRAWRWIKKLKWAGFGHGTAADPMKPAAGELTIFCPACPQPNINLPDNWKTDPNRYITFHHFITTF